MAAIDHPHTLEELEAVFANPSACRESCRNIMEQAIRLAARGHAAALLEIVQHTSEKALFLPLAEGLRLHLGMVITSTGAARALAIFIAEQIRRETNHPFGTHSAS